MEMSEAWSDIFYERYIHQFQLEPFTKFTSSSGNTKLKDILPWNISQMATKAIPISTRIVRNYATKRDIPSWIWWKVNGNWDNNMIRISQRRENHCRTNTSIRRKKEIQKSRTMKITVWHSSRTDDHVGKVTWYRKIITEFTKSINCTRIGRPVLVMDVKVAKDRSISRRVDQENLIYVSWNRIKNRTQRWRRWSIEENK